MQWPELTELGFEAAACKWTVFCTKETLCGAATGAEAEVSSGDERALVRYRERAEEGSGCVDRPEGSEGLCGSLGQL